MAVLLPDMEEVYRAGCPSLGARLLAAASLVPKGAKVADIGCDHGKLAVWLAIKGMAKKVVAVDSRPMPLLRAQALVKQANCGNVVQCRMGSGLFALEPKEVDNIVLAGLSGQSICQILAPHRWVFEPKIQLVLVPASRHALLRHWLCQNGFAIKKEIALAEKGRPYTVISARYCGQVACHGINSLYCQLGLLPKSEDKAAFGLYAEKRIKDLEKQAKGLFGKQLIKHRQLITEVEKCLQ